MLWKKFRWITPIFFIWFDSNFDFKKIWERYCLRKFCFSFDPDPEPCSKIFSSLFLIIY
jgi:hypothetical protein